jgi:hypothetical membrane protein
MSRVFTTPGPSSGTTTRVTRALLAGGVVAGPLFIAVAAIQTLTREGFDLGRHAISMLSLGEGGWVQIASFVVAGLLAIGCAVGMRRALRAGPGATWGPLLVGVFGVGQVAAGVFTTDPAVGFPPGAPEGMPAASSWHAILHSVAFLVAFVSLTAACFVFARRFAAQGERGWAAYCAATGVAAPVLVAMGMTGLVAPGVAFAVAAVVTWAWITATAARLMTELADGRGAIEAIEAGAEPALST